MADELGVSVSTVRHWRNSDTIHDGSHTRRNLLATLSPAQGAIVIVLHCTLLLPLDDLLTVVDESIHTDVSRSALDRWMWRSGSSQLVELRPVGPCDAVKAKPFKFYELGYIHIAHKYMPQVPDESRRRYMFVAIAMATRWVHVAIKTTKSPQAATAFPKAVQAKAPSRICKRFTDNDKAFTHQLHSKRRGSKWRLSNCLLDGGACASTGFPQCAARRPTVYWSVSTAGSVKHW